MGLFCFKLLKQQIWSGFLKKFLEAILELEMLDRAQEYSSGRRFAMPIITRCWLLA